MERFFFSYGLIILSALFDTFAALVVKAQFNKLGAIDFRSISKILEYITEFLKSPALILGVGAFVLAPGLWFLALNRLELSVGYPILVGFHLMFVMVFGILLLNEPFTYNKLIATCFIIISVIILYK